MTSRYASSASSKLGGMVALDPVDRPSPRRRPGRSRGRPRRGRRGSTPSCSSPIARIASASRPSNARSPTSSSYRSRPERPLVGSAGQRRLQPVRVVVEGGPGSRRSRCVSRRRSGVGKVGPGGDDLVEERRQVRGRLDLQPLPDPDLRHGRPGFATRRDSAGTASRRPAIELEPFGQRREVLGEDEEERVADRVERERSPLPDPDDLGVEDRPADVVDLEVALELRRGRQACGVECLDRLRGGPSPRRARRAARLATRRRAGRPRCGSRGTCPTIGLSRIDPPEARLDEVVEPAVERARVRGRLGAGKDDVLESVGHEFLLRRASPARDVRQTPWRCPAATGSVADRRSSTRAQRRRRRSSPRRPIR